MSLIGIISCSSGFLVVLVMMVCMPGGGLGMNSWVNVGVLWGGFWLASEKCCH